MLVLTKGRRIAVAAIVGAATLALAGCSSSDPLAAPSTSPTATGATDAATGPIVIGSQAYYSNEIVAEIYAQALEAKGFTVDRKFNIGQRDAYIPSLESGEIQLFPEYTGNLLQFYAPDTTATTAADVYTALQAALPSGLEVLDQSTATDQDSYNVTADFAAQYGLTSLADLSKVDVPLTLGGAPELEDRPYGPTGLKATYGAEVAFKATGDTTVEDLLAGTVNIANVYSADPRIQTDNLVTLADPEGLFLASNVVPVVNSKISASVADVINAVSAALTPEGLVALNVQSTVDQMSTPDIASAWLKANGLS